MEIYIVISRDRGFIGAYKNQHKAEQIKDSQIESEEFSGGRPSVWIESTELNEE